MTSTLVPMTSDLTKGISEDLSELIAELGLWTKNYLVHRTRTVNYQVLKGMSLKLREDSLLYGYKTIAT